MLLNIKRILFLKSKFGQRTQFCNQMGCENVSVASKVTTDLFISSLQLLKRIKSKASSFICSIANLNMSTVLANTLFKPNVLLIFTLSKKSGSNNKILGTTKF